MNNRCFAVEPLRSSSIDISAAREFGDIRYLFENGEKRPSVYATEKYSSELIRRLKDRKYNPEIDLIVLVGSLIPVTLLVAQLTKEFGSVPVLMYDTHERKYVERVV